MSPHRFVPGAHTAHVFVCIAVLAICSPDASRAQRFAKEWAGTVRATHHNALGYTTLLEGRLKFAYTISGPTQDDYDVVGDELTWSASGASGNCTYSGGPVQVRDEASGFLFIDYLDSTYAISTVVDKLSIFNTTVRESCPDRHGDLPNYGSLPLYVAPEGNFKVSRDGRVLRGAYTYDHPGMGPTLYEWELFGDPEAELELVVRPEDYEQWLPAAGFDESGGGSSMIVEAELRKKDGSPLGEHPESFLFELVAVSREPGIAMNFPRKADALTTPDLRFSNFVSPMEVGPESLWVNVAASPFDPAKGIVVIESYDYGAFGTLRVTATMPDGRKIHGYLDGDESVTDVLLPKRSGGSRIADKWKEDNGVTALEDDDDSEEDPAGDGHRGDGLTLYEEYRGFIVGGCHPRSSMNKNCGGANPRKKDLFVRDDVGGDVAGGIALFRAISGLEVHSGLRAEEMDSTRIMNFNYGVGPHIVDQHGLWIREKSGTIGMAVGGPGPPRKTRYISLANTGGFHEIRRGRAKILTESMGRHVAHELLHGVNVWHHGSGDLWDVTWALQRNAEGQPVLDAQGYPIVLENRTRTVVPRAESGHRFIPAGLFVMKNGTYVEQVTIGMMGLHQGQHSGHEDCVMRYHTSAFYALSAQSTDRYEADGGELAGIGLCESEIGSGVNDRGRSPRSRYGDASRGKCRQQVCVNDLHH